MRLNLGCGEYHAEGWVNVDAYTSTVDVRARLEALPFLDGSATHVYCGHVLEHIAPIDLPAVLVEIRRVLAADGEFCVVGPDCDRIDPAKEPDLYAIAAKHVTTLDNPHGSHLWTCTEAKLLSYIQAVFPGARAVLVAEVPETWPGVVRHASWQCAVIA